MGVFGTSEKEEEQLRNAATSVPDITNRQSSASTTFDTADEEEEITPKTTVLINKEDSSIEEHPELLVSEEPTEDELNRQYSIQRIASNRSMDQMLAIESIPRKHSVVSAADSEHGAKTIAIEDLDWDDEFDKGNPDNFPKWKKWFITATVAIVCLCCSLGSSLYVGGVDELMIKFDVSQELAISGLTFYILGLALGPFLTAPLSELVGRRIIYVVSFPIAMLFAMGVGFSKNIETLLVLRFFTGYFASPALSIAGGTISDIWAKEPVELSLAIALFCLAPFLGPVIGPIIGGFAAQYKGWKWAASYVPLMFMGAILPFLLVVPETYKPIVLKQRAKARGYKVLEPPRDAQYIKGMAKYVFLRPLEMLFLEPIVLIMSIYISFIFAVLFGFFEAFPIIFRGVYHMQLGVSGLPFIGVGLGLVSGVLFYIVLDKVYYFPKNPDGTRGKRDANGNFDYGAPEQKLLLGQIGAVCLPISLFWLGWSGRNDTVHWMAPTAAGFPFGFGLILVFFCVVLYFSMSFPPASVASAMAANNLLRYIMASVFPLFTVQMYEKLHIDWATTLFAFIALAMVPVPFVFAKYGPKLRASSKFGYHAYFRKLAMDKKAKEDAQAAKAAEHEAKNSHDESTGAVDTAVGSSHHSKESFEPKDVEEVSSNRV